MTEHTDSMENGADAQTGFERAAAIVFEFADAARSAALGAAGQQVRQTARQVGGIAEAMRAAARSLDRSPSPVAARYADQVAERIEGFARSLHEHRWREIIKEVEGMARRRPTLFVLGTVAVGFLAGRLLSDPAPRDQSRRTLAKGALPPDEAVKAAISSAAGNGALAGETHEGIAPREPS
jgi:hypothetical protein